MAITFQEKKSRTPWLGIIGAIVIIGSIGMAVFYLFFSKPELAEEFLFPKLKSLTEFSKINANFADSINNSGIKNLKPLVVFKDAESDLIGKTNPFVQ